MKGVKNDKNKNYSDDVYRSSMDIVSSDHKLNLIFRLIDQGGNIIKGKGGSNPDFILGMKFKNNKNGRQYDGAQYRQPVIIYGK